MNLIKFSSLLSILCGIFVNEWVIASLFSYDSSISRLDIRIAIWLIQILFLVFGITLLVKEKQRNISLTRFLKNAYLFVFSIVFSLFLAEYLARTFQPTPNGFPTGTILFKPNKSLGWSFIQNVQTKVTWPMEAQVDVSINGNGFRDTKELENGGIWLLGDSFVSALEVEEEQRFSNILESKINQPIYNFGVNGYGPVQYYLLLDSLLKVATPEMVIVTIYIRNDLYDAAGVVDWMHDFKRPIIKQNNIIYPKNELSKAVLEDQNRYLKFNSVSTFTKK